MTSEDPMPFGKYKGQKLKDVPLDYRKWLISQEGFEQKNPDLFAFFSGKAVSTPSEAETDAAEDSLMSDAPDGFADWWWKQYGKNLRQIKSPMYVGYLRVALEAWKAGLADLRQIENSYPNQPRNPSQYLADNKPSEGLKPQPQSVPPPRDPNEPANEEVPF